MSAELILSDRADVGVITDIARLRRLEESLARAALAVSESDSETLYHDLLNSLTTILGVEGAFIAVYDPDDDNNMDMLALRLDGRVRENMSYPRKGTACETVLERGFRIYPSHLSDQFKGPAEYAYLALESYAGYPLVNAAGRAIGLISVVSRRPLTQPEFIESVLRIFAVRVNAEVGRLAAEERRIRLEDQLRQAQKMEAIGQLTGGIAHDFNNLLTSIMGYLVLAIEREAAIADPVMSGYLAQAHRSCERARDLVRQMLMFSRGQRGSPRSIALDRLVTELLETLRHTIPATTELLVDASPGVPPVSADPLQVEQVLLNLCINASDAVGEVGTVRISVKAAEVHGQFCGGCRAGVDGDFVEMCVEDDGQGMTPEVLARLFEPFFSTKETGKGTGMGLAMVHGIVHEHRGHVLVESAAGRGSRFRVLWPLGSCIDGDTSHTHGDRPIATGRARPRMQGSVLIVDDEAMVGEFMRELLTSWGIEATFARGGQVALDLVAADPRRFKLVISDQTMPRFTGLALAQRLHEIRPGLPVILYTGYSDKLDDEALRVAGVATVLRKPVDLRALETALAATL
jgi:signal transduction histidine kinase/CheY-like chemotaxis protein